MANPQSILVIGAGELGTAVLQALARHPHRESGSTISVLLRWSTIHTPDAAKKDGIRRLTSLGVSFEAGDIEKDSKDTLAKIFRDYDTVIGCSGMAGSTGVQLKLTQAALAAGVKRYIPWQFGVDYDVLGRASSQDLFDEQLDVRAALRAQSQTDWIIISTGIFMSFLFEDFFGVVSQDRMTVRALGSWGNSVTVTTPEDIGQMTAEVVWAGEEIRNEVVFVAGDTVSYAELASILDDLQGKPVQRVEWTVPFLKEELAKDAENGTKKYRVVFAEGKGVSWDKSQSLNARRGIELQTVKEWARKTTC